MAQPILADFVPAARHADSDQERFEASVHQRNRRRVQIFLSVFALAAAVCLAWNYSRAPVYESAAVLKITPRTNSDRTAGVDPPNPVEVQRQMMLSPSVLAQLFEQVAPLHGSEFAPSTLRRLVDADRVPGTDTVRLRAEGRDPEFLPVVLNAWAEIYVAKQKAAEAAVAVTDNDAADMEVEALESKLRSKREEVEAFRSEHSIISPEREENRVAARLRGLNDAHNKAADREIKAKAKLEAVRRAVQAGKVVGNTRETASLSTLIFRAEELREQLRDFEQNFTPAYMRLDPKMRALQENLDSLEQKIRAQRKSLSQSVLTQAEQEVDESRAARLAVKRQLDELRTDATRFSANFARLQSLLAELESLEELVRETKRQQVQLQSKAPTLPPQVRVAEAAYVPDAPIRPLYTRDAGIGLGGSLVLGLLAVLAYEFFIRPVIPPPRQTSATLVYAADERLLQSPRDSSMLLGQADAVHALPNTEPRELSEGEVEALLDETESAPAVQALICTLMSGVSVEEAARLCWSDIDKDHGTVRVPGSNARTLGVSGRLRAAFSAMLPGRGESPIWCTPDGAPLRVAEMRDLVAAAASEVVDSGDANVEGLRHTYVAFLARQGAEQDDILRVVGDVDPSALSYYQTLAPPGVRMPFSELRLVYPPLATG